MSTLIIAFSWDATALTIPTALYALGAPLEADRDLTWPRRRLLTLDNSADRSVRLAHIVSTLRDTEHALFAQAEEQLWVPVARFGNASERAAVGETLAAAAHARVLALDAHAARESARRHAAPALRPLERVPFVSPAQLLSGAYELALRWEVLQERLARIDANADLTEAERTEQRRIEERVLDPFGLYTRGNADACALFSPAPATHPFTKCARANRATHTRDRTAEFRPANS